MADRIKGITIEIGGDTTGLNKALSGVNKEIRNTQSQLKDVERLLKLDPSNTELLRQKQKLLADAVGETKTKLNTLKEAERQAQQQFAEGKISEDQYNSLKREVAATEQQLKSLEDQAGKANITLQQISLAGEKFQEFGNKVTDVGKKILPISAAAAGIGVASIKTAADFDESMSKVSAISGAAGEDFVNLRNKAREMGAETKYSASEAADAFTYMAMAGWDAGQMMDGIDGIMSLAAADGLDLATTSDIVTDALTAFGYQAADASHFADVLATASSSANTNVSMLGESFKYVAPVAGTLGYSAEDTAIALGLMANAGIKGSQAGTSLKTALANLTSPTSNMARVMTAYNIELENSDGTMKSLAQVMDELRTNMKVTTDAEREQNYVMQEQKIIAEGYSQELSVMSESEKKLYLEYTKGQDILSAMTEEQKKEAASTRLNIKLSKKRKLTNEEYYKLCQAEGKDALEGITQAEQASAAATLFGKESMAGMLNIINASEEDYKKLSDAINNADGTAKKMADTMQDNLSGQLTILKSQLQELAISIGDLLMPTIRKIVSKTQELVDWFNSLDDSSKEVIVTVGLIVAALGPLLIIVGQTSTGIGALMTTMSTLGPMIAALGAAGGPTLLLVGALGLLTTEYYNVKNAGDEYYEQAKELSDEEKKSIENVDTLSQSYKQLDEQRQSTTKKIESQAFQEQTLLSELKKITDENGNIQAGYEERAKVITTQLQDALGVEIELIDNQIVGYQDLCANIDELIKKKQAEALLQANEAGYAEALQKQMTAYEEYLNLKNQAAEAENNLAKARENEQAVAEQQAKATLKDIALWGVINAQTVAQTRAQNEAAASTQGYAEKYSELSAKLTEAENLYKSYNDTISNYEGLSSAIIVGDQAKIDEAILQTTYNFQTAETANKETLENQANHFREMYTLMEQAAKDGSESVTQAQLDTYKELVDKSQQELGKLPGIAGNTAIQTVQSLSSHAPEFIQAGKNVVSGFASGIIINNGEAIKSVTDLAEKTISTIKSCYKINSPSKVTKEIGKYFDEGLQEGIENGSSKIIKAVINLSNETIAKTKENLSQEAFSGIGEQIAAGLSGGILSGKSNVLASIQQICSETISTARSQLGIHSPSKEFAYIGQMSGEGFVEGWNGTATGIQTVISNSVDLAINKMAETVKGTEAALLSLRDSSGNTISEMVKSAEEAQKALEKIQDGLESTISGQIDMFSEFDGKSKTSTDELLNNMQSQVDGTEQWSNNLRTLAERGIDQGLLQKMAEMGPKGAGYVTTFTQMTDEELQRANNLFAQSMKLPESTAANIMQSYQVAGKMAAQGYSDGIQENIPMVGESTRKIAEISTNMIKSLLEIHSPSRVTAEIGRFFTIGLAEGINEGISSVNTAVEQVAAVAVLALSSSLNISSASVQSYQTQISSGWTAWAAGLSQTLSVALSNINITTNTQMLSLGTIFNTQLISINTQWMQRLQEMEVAYKSKMDKINAIQTSTLTAMAILNKFKTQEIKADTVKATTDMVTEVGTSLEPLTGVVEQGFAGATSYIQGLIPKSKIWAADFMDGYISTIRAKISELEAACEEVADTVSEYLHFTRPDKGPLRNYEEWMPHMMQGLAKGIRDNRGLMLDQMKGLTADMAGTIQGSNQQVKQPVNLTSYNVFTIEGKQIAEVVNEQLGVLL